MKLSDSERVVTAWAESCSGPGWANQLVWVLVQDREGKLRLEALQPDEQSGDMQAIFRYSALAAADMTRAAWKLGSSNPAESPIEGAVPVASFYAVCPVCGRRMTDGHPVTRDEWKKLPEAERIERCAKALGWTIVDDCEVIGDDAT